MITDIVGFKLPKFGGKGNAEVELPNADVEAPSADLDTDPREPAKSSNIDKDVPLATFDPSVHIPNVSLPSLRVGDLNTQSETPLTQIDTQIPSDVSPSSTDVPVSSGTAPSVGISSPGVSITSPDASLSLGAPQNE